MNKKLALFIIIVIAHLAGNITDILWLRMLTRVMLMPSLLWWFLSQIEKPYSTVHRRMITALIFGTAGDVCAALSNFSEWFFLLDISFFLVMQLLYVLTFLSIINFRDLSASYFVTAIVIVITYGIIILTYLLPHLGWFTLPVLLYASAVTLSVITSALTKSYFSKKLFVLLLSGTILYLFSDSIIAINKFITPFSFASFFGLLGYAIAQLFIVIVISKYKE